MMDLIERQAAIDAMMQLQDEDIEAYGCEIPEGFDGDRAVMALRELPSAEPEIIHCRDCKYYDGRPCGIVDWYNTDSDFCSRAARKENG